MPAAAAARLHPTGCAGQSSPAGTAASATCRTRRPEQAHRAIASIGACNLHCPCQQSGGRFGPTCLVSSGKRRGALHAWAARLTNAVRKGGTSLQAESICIQALKTARPDEGPYASTKVTRMEPFLGQIQLLPYNFAPQGWAFCEGQMLQISQNSALFALLGTMYGGDGRVTFALPNLKGKEPDPNMHYCIATEGIFPSRA